MTASPALLLAAAGVAFGHAILPDHWAPLAVVGRTRRYPLTKVARPSGLAGVATPIGSLVVFAAVTITTIVGLTLLATAGGYQIGGRWLDRWVNAFTAAVLIVIGALVLAGVL